jgi:hypothetical protein
MLNKNSAKAAALFAVFITLVIFNFPHPGYGFDFEPRSITLSTGTPSAVASHNFILAPAQINNIGSLVFEYCSNSPLVFVACTPPAGMDASGAVLASQSGNTGFSIDTADSTGNKIVLSRISAPAIMTPSTYNFDNITNPSTPAETVYVRLNSYASSDGTGPYIDKGAATFAVQTPFTVNTFVPPFLAMCVGITVAPDCSSIIGDSIDLGTISSKHANTGQSQYATATNDPSGYVIFAEGNTMTSGNNTIPALLLPTPSFPGTGQFGINLRANIIPPIGQDPVGLGTGVPTANYNQPNKFMFNSGDTISSSIITTNYNRMTVSYLVNVPANQTPGVYATTITYIATVQF